MKTTIELYKKAYKAGQWCKENNDFQSFRTKCLDKAWELGFRGIEINFDDIVTCVRAGEIPDGGISYNYREQENEDGLSVLNVIGENEIGSAVWFSERENITVKGIRLPLTGSDDETLILPLDINQYDY